MRQPIPLVFGLALSALACSSEGGSDDPTAPPFSAGGVSPAGTNDGTPAPGTGGTSAGLAGVDNVGRPLGMAIGQGATGPVTPGSAGPPPAPAPGGGAAPGEPPGASEELEIPVFEAPADEPPCSGCIELNMLVNDINQRDDFVFDAGGVNVTRVIWTIVVPFNSDQLFVQPFVDQSFGTYTDLDANAFALDTPVQLVHEYSGTANGVGIAIGSSGAWTGNMTMSLFIESVTLEGADGASRSFDAGVEGFAARTTTNSPQVVYHP
jgi:hypothetical protein